MQTQKRERKRYLPPDNLALNILRVGRLGTFGTKLSSAISKNIQYKTIKFPITKQ